MIASSSLANIGDCEHLVQPGSLQVLEAQAGPKMKDLRLSSFIIKHSANFNTVRTGKEARANGNVATKKGLFNHRIDRLAMLGTPDTCAVLFAVAS